MKTKLILALLGVAILSGSQDRTEVRRQYLDETSIRAHPTVHA